MVPELELTVVTTSNPAGPRAGGHTRSLHDLVTDYFIPAAERGGRSGSEAGTIALCVLPSRVLLIRPTNLRRKA